MRFYVVKVNALLKCTVLAAIVLLAALIVYFSEGEVTAVFQQKRDLPIYSVDYPEKKVALTFDCAWGSEDIPQILNTLKEHDVKASFFMIGVWAEKNPEAVKMIAEHGHDVANHSYSHFRMGSIDNGKIRTEIIKCDSVLEKLTGKKVELFRAPYGDYNNNVVRIAKELNHFTIQWDVETLNIKVKHFYQYILQNINIKARFGLRGIHFRTPLNEMWLLLQLCYKYITIFLQMEEYLTKKQKRYNMILNL